MECHESLWESRIRGAPRTAIWESLTQVETGVFLVGRGRMSYKSWPEPANDWDRELADLGNIWQWLRSRITSGFTDAPGKSSRSRGWNSPAGEEKACWTLEQDLPSAKNPEAPSSSAQRGNRTCCLLHLYRHSPLMWLFLIGAEAGLALSSQAQGPVGRR